VIFLLLASFLTGTDYLILGSSSADLITTEIALRHSSSLMEGNPVMKDTGTRLGLKMLSTGLALTVTHELRKRKKYKAAKIFAISTSVFWGGIAIHNAILTRTH
jgi:hypothetical protein